MLQKILITGGCGFVGSNLAIELKSKYPNYEIFCFDNLKRRGSELNISRLKERGILFVHGDIRNVEDFEELPKDITTVIDASAEPSVLAGLEGTPNYLVHTNFNGTLNCLNYTHRCGADFIFLSTSRVYPINYLDKINYSVSETRFEIDDHQDILGVNKNGITEKFPLGGHRSLYGATKLSSELIIAEYHEYMGMNTVINRCGVIAGPYQMGKVDQGVIVLWVAKHFWKKSLKYIGYGGKGLQVRDVLHIEDLYKLIDYQIHHMKTVSGRTMNVGGGRDISVSLRELTDLCQRVTGNKIIMEAEAETRKADIPIYITDNSYVEELCGWTPSLSTEKLVADIFEWIRSNEPTLRTLLS